MHKVDTAGGTKVLAEVKDLKEMAYGGLVATGPSYAGIASDKGIRIRSIKGKSIQNLGGGVKPSPDTPVAIKGVDIRSIVSTGKNEIKLQALTPLEYNGITFQPVYANGELKCVKVNGTSTGQANYPLEAEIQNLRGEYVVSGCPEGGGAGRYNLCIGFYSKESGAWVSESYQTGPDLTIDCTLRNASISIVVRKGITCDNLVFYPMMRRKGTSGEYEPPKRNEVKKILTLWSLPDGTHDEYKDGKIIRRVGMLNLTGQENWVKAPMARNQFAFEYGNLSAIGDTASDVQPNLFCSHFSQITADDSWITLITGITTRKGMIRIKFADQATINTVDKFKSWLSTHPVYVLYPLAGEQIEEVKIPILPSQHSYTQVYTDSPVDTDIEWEILTSSNNDAAIEDLIARVSALESEAVSNA